MWQKILSIRYRLDCLFTSTIFAARAGAATGSASTKLEQGQRAPSLGSVADATVSAVAADTS